MSSAVYNQALNKAYLPRLSDDLLKAHPTLTESNTASAGFFSTLAVLICTLLISEAFCLCLLQIISKITWYGFYSDFPSIQSFQMDPYDVDSIREQRPIVSKEQIESSLITMTWNDKYCQPCNTTEENCASGSCAICLNDYEDKDEISRSRYCKHYIHTSCYKLWLTKGKNTSCPYCRTEVLGINSQSKRFSLSDSRRSSIRNSIRLGLSSDY